MEGQLTKHFHVDEFVPTIEENSNERRRWQMLAGEVRREILERMLKLARALEQVRSILGNQPIVITSGWRSQIYNELVGGSPTSDHPEGHCADFRRAGMSPGQIYRMLRKAEKEGNLAYDQLIGYKTHVHLGMGARMRGMSFTK